MSMMLIINSFDGWMDEFLFYIFSVVVQSYQDNVIVVMKAVCYRISFRVRKISASRDCKISICHISSAIRGGFPLSRMTTNY